MVRKLLLFWLVGGILILGSIWTASHSGFFGDNMMGLSLAVLISFVLLMAGGLSWIAVASATAKH